MRILIVGAGKVGHALALHLAREEHDVTVLDTDDEAIRRCEDTLDVLCVSGNGANANSLLEAGADKADILIAATASDEVNMLSCLIAKRLGTRYSIARIRDPGYNESLNLLKNEMGIDMAVNPERATALEISRLLRYPYANDIETFAKGRVEMVAFRAQKGDPFLDIPLYEISKKLKNFPQVLFAAVERDGELTIPRGDFRIRAEDRVHVAADMVNISAFFRYLGRNTAAVKNVMIMGGGRISYYLSKMIVPIGIRVTLLEISEEKANRLSEMLPDVNVICGDGTDQEVLTQEGLEEMDAFIALGNRDEENLMTGLYANHRKVKKVVVKNNRESYEELIQGMGLECMVSPKDITSQNILRYVRGRVNASGTKVERLYQMMGNQAETLEFVARAGDSYIGIPLMKLHILPDSLVAVILRDNRVIVPFGGDTIEVGDRVVIITKSSGISDLNEVIGR